MKKLLLIAICSFSFFSAQSQIITTFAGNGSNGFSGDNGLATLAKIGLTGRIAIDINSNLFIADTYNDRIRKIDATTGIITTVAGTGTAGYNGDGALATVSQLNKPFGVAIDPSGNIYIADGANNRIRKISAATGIISTVAGNGTAGYNGDSISAITAQIKSPNSVCIDNGGNIYFSDQNNHRIRKVTIATGNITTVAGNGISGFLGDGASAISAKLNSPSGIALDVNNNIYIADFNNHRIRKVTVSTGMITTIAGNGNAVYDADGVAANTTGLANPHDVFVNSAGHVFIVDYGNGRIRKVNATTGLISTVAGDGSFAFAGDNGPATSAKFKGPISITFDNAGNYYIADFFNYRIRKVTQPVFSNNTISGSQTICANSQAATLSGSLPLGCTGTITYTWLSSSVSATAGFSAILNSNLQNFTPSNLMQNTWFRRIAITAECNSDTSSSVLISINIPIGNNILGKPATISRIAGQTNGIAGSTGDGGLALNAALSSQGSICLDSAKNIYIPNNGSKIRKINSSTGVISTYAGTVNNSYNNYNGDGIAAITANLYSAYHVAVDRLGDLYISELLRIRKVSKTTGLISTVAGTGIYGFSGDGALASLAQIWSSCGLTLDANENIYFVDRLNFRIRKITKSTGIISTIAGTGTNTSGADGALATLTNITPNDGIAIDKTGDVYFAEFSRIRKIDAVTGIISTIAGNGIAGFTGDGGLATQAKIFSSGSICIDNNGNLFFADIHGDRIRRVNLKTGLITSIAGGGSTINPNNSIATTVDLVGPKGVNLDIDGNLYFSVNGFNQAFKMNSSSSDQTICAGAIPDSIVASTPIGGNGLGYTYQWLKSTNSANAGFTAIAFSNKKNYAPTALSQTTWFKRVVSSGICASDTSVASKITVQNAITNNVLTNSDQIICAGNMPAAITASVARGGDGLNYIYTWLKSTYSASAGFTAIANSNTQNYSTPTLAQSTWFKRAVSSGFCGLDTSSTILISINIPIGNNILGKPATISRIAGNEYGNIGFSGDGGLAINSKFYNPVGICSDSANNIFIADGNNHRIRKINAATGVITTIAGTGFGGYNLDGIAATTSNLKNPFGLALNRNGDLFIADKSNHRIRKISKTTGLISTVAGTGTANFSGDGSSSITASISKPLFLTFDKNGNLFFVDADNFRIRKITTSTDIISTVAGTGVAGYQADGALATLTNISPKGIAIDQNGNVYFSEGNCIRKINANTGIINTIVGTGINGFSGDGGMAIDAKLNSPEGIFIDNNQNLLIADYYNERIRSVNLKTGLISTIAGGGSNINPLNNIPTTASLVTVGNVTAGIDGSVYITTYYDSQVFKLNIALADQTICAGAIPDSIVASTPIGGNGLGYTYQWLKSTTSATAGFTTIAFSNNKNFVPTALSQTTWFKRVVSSGICASDTSVASKITVQNPITNNTITNPTQIICAGTAPATITASIPSGGANTAYNFVWLSSTTSASAGFNSIINSNTQSFTPATLSQSTWFKRAVSSGVCGYDTTFSVKIIVTNLIATNTITSAAQIICSGTVPAQITASTATGGDGFYYNYSWLKSTTSATSGFTSIQSSYSQNYSPAAISQNTWFKRVTSSGACTNDTTAAIKITTTNSIATNTITSLAQTICSGTVPAQISASNATGGDGINYVYTWLKSTYSASIGFSAIVSSNNKNYTPSIITQNTWFKRVTSSGACVNDTSAAIKISITQPITANIITSSAQTICRGTIPAQIIASTATGGDGINYVYSWLKSTYSSSSGFSAILSSNSKNYTPSAVSQNTWFKRVSSSGTCANDTSVAIKISITNPITTNTIISNAQTICSGSIPAQITASTATGGDGLYYSYQWLSSTTNAYIGFSALDSGYAQNYSPKVISQNTWFKRVASSGLCANDTSAAIKFSITNPIANNTITSAVQTICSGSVPTQITASTATGGDGLNFSYHWLSSTINASIGFSVLDSSYAQNYSPKVISQNTWFKRVVSSGLCANDTSAAIKISITNPIATNTITSTAQTICSGSVPAQITASAATGGDGLYYSYQWLSSTTNASTGFSALDSSYAQNYSPKVLFQNTWFKRVASSGLCTNDTSAAISVIINYSITGNIINNSLQVICSGTIPPQLTATIPSGGDGINYAYQWLRSTTNSAIGYVAVDSSYSQNYSPKALFQNTWFKRVVTAGPCAADTSASIFILVTKPVTNNSITTNSYSICEGNTPSEILAAKATGGDGLLYIYAWLSSTTNANSGFSDIIAGNTQNYTPTNFTKSIWFKRVVISGVCAADTSAAIKISFEKNPAKPIITATSATELTSTIANTYQWYYNSNLIAGSTVRTLTINKNGNYAVKIDSINGCINKSIEYSVSTLGINEIDANATFAIYPNPATNEIYVALNASNSVQNALIEVYDLKGSKIITEHQNFEINKPVKIDLGDLVSGLYFIRINQQSFKFIKSN